MKNVLSLFFVVVVATTVSAQSKSFVTLKERFEGVDNVYSFQTSGFFARLVLKLAGEHQFVEAIEELRSIRLMVIPKKAFDNEGVSLAGFRIIAKNDSFQELAHIRDHGDQVTVLLQEGKRSRDNRYLVLVNDPTEVVAIELKGYIDTDLLKDELKEKSNNKSL